MSRDHDKSYWRSPEELRQTEPLEGAAAETTAGLGRREFMRLAGFTLGAGTLVGCSRGVEHGVMPYLVRPEEVTPGRSYWYASVCGGCPAGCGMLAKNRDGRPIKLEGNPEHPLSAGGLCAVGQASVVGLYDARRLREPLRAGVQTSWSEVDDGVGATLRSLQSSGGRVRFLSDSLTGPAERESIERFVSRFADGRSITYDPLSLSAIADAHQATHGARIVPRYRFDRAEVIVGLGADFLGGWLSPVEHTAGYRAGRRLEGQGDRFSHHVQFESRMTLTGSNADRRIAVSAGTIGALLIHLAHRLAPLSGVLPACPVDPSIVAGLARRLRAAPRGRTLVVCGENDIPMQRLVNRINHLLGNEGTTVDLDAVSTQRRGSDAELAALLDELAAGDVDALFVRGVNPLYDLPGADGLAAALDKVKLVVSFAERVDETAERAGFVCPEPHFLEGWGDAEPVAGVASLRQPTIRPLGSTRSLLESLAVWSGAPASAYDLMRESWRTRVYPRRQSSLSFDDFWNRALHDGFVSLRRPPATRRPFDAAAVGLPESVPAVKDGELRLDLYEAAGARDGRHAHNPWLHELPDPIAKTVWDNSIALSAAAAAGLDARQGDVVRVTAVGAEGGSIELPLLVQPGQDDRSAAIALGYGRKGTDRFSAVGPQWWEGRPTVEPGDVVGTNAAPLLGWRGGTLAYTGHPVRLEKTGRRHTLATTQMHHSLHVPPHLAFGDDHPRPIVQETSLAAWRSDPAAGGHGHHEPASLWHEHPKSPHHWGMAVDLTACTGCSACVIACQAENNVPVVGKDEVRRAREMHWMRIDRYYSGDGPDVDVVHMPMMCQHCDNAPCETVCPVQATAQSAEGLNQQVYNRCVGTRYCANNCPYKVRRFNWFNYPREDRLQNLALNPDVTVRSRGVMEKCSLCVQRIHDAKAESKRTGRPLQDGDIAPACVQSCPAGAIVFGDMNDPQSAISGLKHDPRHFTVLPELGVKPVVGYLTLVRNREKTREPHSDE